MQRDSKYESAAELYGQAVAELLAATAGPPGSANLRAEEVRTLQDARTCLDRVHKGLAQRRK